MCVYEVGIYSSVLVSKVFWCRSVLFKRSSTVYIELIWPSSLPQQTVSASRQWSQKTLRKLTRNWLDCHKRRRSDPQIMKYYWVYMVAAYYDIMWCWSYRDTWVQQIAKVLQHASWKVENHNCAWTEVGHAEARKIIRFICGKWIVVFHCSACMLQDFCNLLYKL